MNTGSDYFAARGVNENSYRSFQLPIYLRPILPGQECRILDIGCGMGQMLVALRGLGYSRLYGIDIAIDAVEVCQRNGLQVERIRDLRDWLSGFTGEKFEFVIMSHVLEHLPKEQIIDVLKLIRGRVLTRGGRLCVMVPNAQANTGCYWAYEDFTHTCLFTAGSLLFVLRVAGFDEIHILDPDGTAYIRPWLRPIKKVLLSLYKLNKLFWNRVTSSAYHQPSPMVFSYELKAIASNHSSE